MIARNGLKWTSFEMSEPIANLTTPGSITSLSALDAPQCPWPVRIAKRLLIAALKADGRQSERK